MPRWIAALDGSGRPLSGDGTIANGASRRWRRSVPARPDGPWDTLRLEIDRSRRYRHSVTLVRVVPPVVREAPRRRGARDALASSVEAVRACLRAGDSVWREGDAIFLLLPETERGGADALLARIRGCEPALLADAEMRAAAFPEDGLTCHAVRAAVLRPPAARARPAIPVMPRAGHAQESLD
jgi:hypothetical protein